jgi:hypothetical protein
MEDEVGELFGGPVLVLLLLSLYLEYTNYQRKIVGLK